MLWGGNPNPVNYIVPPWVYSGEKCMRRAIVYEVVNTVTGEDYIGHTRRTLRDRKKDHIRGALNGHANGLLAAAIRAYGKDAFSWRELRSFPSIAAAYRHERALITERTPAYNHPTRVGPYRPRVIRQSLRNTLREIGIANREKWQQYAHLGPAAMAKPVVCLTDGGRIFASASKAARAYGVPKNSVSQVCARGKSRLRTGGHIFRYADDCEGGLPAALAEIAALEEQARQSRARHKRPIIPRDQLPEPKGELPNLEHLPDERWERVPFAPEHWAVSDHGRVCSLDRVVPHRTSGTLRRKGRLLRQGKDKDGYAQICLNGLGRAHSWKVHALVAHVFIGPRPEGLLVLHRNGINTDNRASNLYYGTQKDNIEDARAHGALSVGVKRWNARRTEQEIRDIRALARSMSQYKVAKIYGFSRSYIQKIVERKAWAHVKDDPDV